MIVYEKRWFVKNGSKLFGIITQINRVETIKHASNKDAVIHISRHALDF